MAYGADKIVRQLIRHVQPPACGARPGPVREDALVAKDKVPVAGVELVDVGQRGEVPPAVVAIRVGAKAVPAVIGRVRVFVSAQVLIAAVAIKIPAVRTRVRKHPVEHQAYAKGAGLLGEGAKGFLRAEDGVDAVIVRRVVAVVAGGLEDRVQVKRRHTERGQVGQLFADALEVAAKKVVRGVNILPGGGLNKNLLRPAVVQAQKAAERRVILGAFPKILPAAAAKAVGENLVGDALREPARRGKGGIVYGNLPGGRLVRIELALAAARAVVQRLPVRTVDDEGIPDGHRAVRRVERHGYAAVFARHGQQLFAAGPPEPELHIDFLVAADLRREAYAGRAGDRAKRRSKSRQPRVMPKKHHALFYHI